MRVIAAAIPQLVYRAPRPPVSILAEVTMIHLTGQ
jgi:hypothetical protein